MTDMTNDPVAKADHSTLHFLDGSTSLSSYAVIARRGNIFLGVKFCYLVDGSQLGAPGRSYLYVSLRSARDQALAAELDQKAGGENVVHLSDQHLALADAWPAITFEKIDPTRASTLLGMFIAGSLPDKTHEVIGRIREGDLLRKLLDHAIALAGAVNCIAKPDIVAGWLASQANPQLELLLKKKHQMVLLAMTQKAFKQATADQLEAPGPHFQQLQAIYSKLAQAHLDLEKGQGTS
jgi:hypothetical protein